MSDTLTFAVAPASSLLSAALHRGRTLAPGETIPRIEAVADAVSPDSLRLASVYSDVTGFAAADPLPITFPVVLTSGLQLAVMSAPEFPLPVLGIVHTRQTITRFRHFSGRERLSASVVVEGHRIVRGGGEFDLVTELRAGSETVWRGVTTILSRGIRGDGVKRLAEQPPTGSVTRSVRWRLGADQGRRYAAVSGDYNPIHLTALSARLFGFPRAIAHGWWTLARCLAEMDTDVPEAAEVDVRFLAPVSLPGTVTFESGPLTAVGKRARFEVRGRTGKEHDARLIVGTLGEPGSEVRTCAVPS